MNDSTKKIVHATLVLTVGWALSWPFRKAAEPPGMSTANLSKRSPWTDSVSMQKRAPLAATFEGREQVPDTLIPTTQLASHASQGKHSSPAADHHAPRIRQPRSFNPSHESQFYLSDKPMVVSQTGLAPRPSGPKQHGPHSPLSSNPGSRVPTGLPIRMPGHYEPDYAFPKPVPPKPKSSASPSEQMQPRPAYATALGSLYLAGQSAPVWPQEIFHEIQNSDTLEKLAKRYLGDPARALEIFDFNRDKLKNPEILPIGAELRIPAKG